MGLAVLNYNQQLNPVFEQDGLCPVFGGCAVGQAHTPTLVASTPSLNLLDIDRTEDRLLRFGDDLDLELAANDDSYMAGLRNKGRDTHKADNRSHHEIEEETIFNYSVGKLGKEPTDKVPESSSISIDDLGYRMPSNATQENYTVHKQKQNAAYYLYQVLLAENYERAERLRQMTRDMARLRREIDEIDDAQKHLAKLDNNSFDANTEEGRRNRQYYANALKKYGNGKTLDDFGDGHGGVDTHALKNFLDDQKQTRQDNLDKLEQDRKEEIKAIGKAPRSEYAALSKEEMTAPDDDSGSFDDLFSDEGHSDGASSKNIHNLNAQSSATSQQLTASAGERSLGSAASEIYAQKNNVISGKFAMAAISPTVATPSPAPEDGTAPMAAAQQETPLRTMSVA